MQGLGKHPNDVVAASFVSGLSFAENFMSIITFRLHAVGRMIAEISGYCIRSAIWKSPRAILTSTPEKTACYFGSALQGAV